MTITYVHPTRATTPTRDPLFWPAAPSGRIDLWHPTRPRPAHLVGLPDSDGRIRLRAGESLTIARDTIPASAAPRHECEHCYRGYRTDFTTIDHYGQVDAITEDCSAMRMPCYAHRCYWAS